MIDTTMYRTRLEDEKATLETELESVGRRNPTNPNDWEPVPQNVGQEADPNDRADLITQFEDNTAILKDLEIRHGQVLAALARIEGGTFGTCQVAGEEIEEERLNADPAATTCKIHLNG